jgi:DNA-binding HxlR family transcriptional regulator
MCASRQSSWYRPRLLVPDTIVPRKNALPGNRASATARPFPKRDLDDLLETAATGCPLTAAIRAIGGKWNLICLYWLEIEPRRFNELRRLMPGISHKVLTETLRTLEAEGLVSRRLRARANSHVEYRISGHGESVIPLIHAVRAWGRDHLERSNPARAARQIPAYQS